MADDNPDEQGHARYARVGVLKDEVNQLVTDADQRLTSVSNKASFLAVAAGVVIAAASSQEWSQLRWFGVIALALGCAGLLCAAVALRPGKRRGLKALRLTDKYLDSTRSAKSIEEEILKDKAKAIDQRESGLVARAIWVQVGFGALVLSTISLTVVFAATTLGGS
jgi:hypothetical protein